MDNKDTDIANLNFEIVKYKAIFENSLDLILILDEKGIILEINEAVENLLGYNSEELIGKHYNELFSTDITDSFKDLDEINMYGEVLSSRILLSKDSVKIPFDITINTLNWKNQKVILVNCRNASERIKAEKEIREYNLQLEELLATKDKFFSIVAHDLRNLFSALIGFSDILISDYSDLKEEDKAFFLKEIERVSKNSYQLLENLLQWARSHTDRIAILNEEIPLKDFVNDILSVVGFLAKEKNIKVVNGIDDELNLNSDKFMLSTILRNIISNAIKFTDFYGEISIYTEENDSSVSLVVEDNGIGMDNITKENLFKLSKQKNRSGTNNERGTGLGLLICKEFADKLNIVLDVESEEGEGSKFFLRFFF